MKANVGFQKALLTIALFTSLATPRATAQQPQLASMAGAIAKNSQQLKQYTFKQRTEMYYKGEMKSVHIDQVHFTAGGERTAIPLDTSVPQQESRRRGPGSRIAARVAEQKKEEIQDYTERLMALTSRYLSPEASKMQMALQQADVTTSGGSNLARVAMQNFAKTGDVVTMVFDSATHRPMRTEVSSSLDDSPVSIVVSFDRDREGPNYPAKTIVTSATKGIEVRILTYDYRL